MCRVGQQGSKRSAHTPAARWCAVVSMLGAVLLAACEVPTSSNDSNELDEPPVITVDVGPGPIQGFDNTSAPSRSFPTIGLESRLNQWCKYKRSCLSGNVVVKIHCNVYHIG